MAELAIAAVKPDADGKKAIQFTPENYEKIYLEWMEQHPRLVHLAPALVGPSHSRMALRRLPQDHRARARPKDPTACAHCGSANITQETDVLDTWFSSGLLPVSVFGWPNITPETLAEFRRLLPDLPPRHRLRHSLLLGRAHDHVRLLVLARCSHARWQPAPARGIGSVPRGLHPRPRARRQPRKDVQDQGQRHRPH